MSSPRIMHARMGGQSQQVTMASSASRTVTKDESISSSRLARDLDLDLGFRKVALRLLFVRDVRAAVVLNGHVSGLGRRWDDSIPIVS